MEITLNRKSLFTDEETENYLISVFAGIITKAALSFDYHLKITDRLSKAVTKGFKSFIPGSPNNDLYTDLIDNIYVFSAAKQYQQVRQMSAIINQLGENAQYTDFRDLANEVFEDYNENYLQAEFQTAIGQSQSARDWQKIQDNKDIFPLLQYKTQKDVLVRDSHQILDDIIRPVDDKFWHTRMPKNGWRCRCFTVQLDSGEVSPIPENINSDDFPVLFEMNPGKDRIIFDPTRHPYFHVGSGDAVLRENNFNLPHAR